MKNCFRIKLYQTSFLILLFTCIEFFFTCYGLPQTGIYNGWKPFFALGAGAVISSDIGQSRYFPIEQINQEFFAYSANHTTQFTGLGDFYLGIEKTFKPHWILQIGLAYDIISAFGAKGSLLQGADISSADAYLYNYNIAAKQLLITEKLLYTWKDHYHPYFIAGLGTSFNRAYNYTTNVSPYLAFTRFYNNHTMTSFSYAMGIGIDDDLTSQLRFGIGYRFANLGAVKLGQAFIDTTPVTGTLSQNHFYTHEILMQLTWILS